MRAVKHEIKNMGQSGPLRKLKFGLGGATQGSLSFKISLNWFPSRLSSQHVLFKNEIKVLGQSAPSPQKKGG